MFKLTTHIIAKCFYCFVFSMLTMDAFADDFERDKTIVISYDFHMNFDKNNQKIVAHLHNKSAIDLKIQQDQSTTSFFAKKIRLFAFEDTDKLSRLQLNFSVDPTPTLVSIEANETFDVKVDLLPSPKYYCDVLNKSPILIFWYYNYYDGKYLLYPSIGIFRINKSDVKC